LYIMLLRRTAMQNVNLYDKLFIPMNEYSHRRLRCAYSERHISLRLFPHTFSRSENAWSCISTS